MKVSLDALAVLDAIDRRGSFAAAAEELHRVPSAITYTINKLEGELDVALFDRSGHRAVLTPAGRELVQAGRHLLRAANALEGRLKRVATGWEAELRIAVGDLINKEAVLAMAGAFYRQESGTRLRFGYETYGGVWDALISDRADLAIGAPAEGPSGGGYASIRLGTVDFVFAIAPDHPLAAVPEPLRAGDILAHRAVTAADSSRNLLPRTSGLLSGQEVLTVPDMVTKYHAQCRGLGVGFLPQSWVAANAAAGRLLPREVEEHREPGTMIAAWRTEHVGNALQWFVDRLRQAETVEALLSPPRL